MLSLLNRRSGAEHFSVFAFEQEVPSPLASVSLDGSDTAHRQVALYLEGQHWRRDPAIPAARRLCGSASVMTRLDVAALPDGELRNLVYGRSEICERIMIWGKRSNMTFGLSVLRSNGRGAFADLEVDQLSGLADTLISALAKHAEFRWRAPRRTPTLTSLHEIEACVASAPQSLSPREIAVCARMLYGMSAIGIGLDLGISEESVITYRKRAFLRLGIATRHELLLWYLTLWGSWDTGSQPRPNPDRLNLRRGTRPRERQSGRRRSSTPVAD